MSELNAPRKVIEAFIWSLYATIISWITYGIIRTGISTVVKNPIIWFPIGITFICGGIGLFLSMKYWVDIWCASWDRKIEQAKKVRKKKKELRKKKNEELDLFKKTIEPRPEDEIFGR